MEQARTESTSDRPGNLRLSADSRVAVLGGGPAGSFFAYFLLSTAERAGLHAAVDIYEYRDFRCPGPQGCNMCGGIISESLVQFLATEGIALPPEVVQRGIASYTLHADVGSVRIDTPLHEKRIAAIHRGPGPRDLEKAIWKSFDGHLQGLAVDRGARVKNLRVEAIDWSAGRPRLQTREGTSPAYDLLAIAVGVNSSTLKLFEGSGIAYRPPEVTKTHIREYKLPRELIDEYLGDSMHVFLLNIPRLEFAALIPKGEYVTACLLGEDIDNSLIDAFLDAPEVKQCFPPSWRPEAMSCKCSPRISVRGAARPFADRLVFIGDSGVTRLYKDGIGAAYRTAKAAATTAVLHGVSAADFENHYAPVCRGIERDNGIGRKIFAVSREVQKRRFARKAIVRMVAAEQAGGSSRRMSTILWDMFTGSAPYRDILVQAAHPRFVTGLLRATLASLLPFNRRRANLADGFGKRTGELGRVYGDGEVIVRQGDVGDCMHVVEDGQVEVVKNVDGRHMRYALLGPGDFFGEMALFENEVRSATVRAVGRTRVLTIDKAALLGRIDDDPALAFRLVESLCHRIRTERDIAPTEITPSVGVPSAAAPTGSAEA
jgi:flavin-dependent dehydrogenase